MIFELLTLIDITQTNARRGDDPYAQKQQQNFLTAMQTISLRANPILNFQPSVEKIDVTGMGFGKGIKGKHNVWRLVFEFEAQGVHSLDFLETDFDLVPVIGGLNETVKLKNNAFLTNGTPDRNIIFRQLDKYN